MKPNRPGSPGKKNIILNIVLLLCVGVIVFCGVKIVQSLIEYQKADAIYDDLEGIGNLTVTTTTTPPVTGTAGPEGTTAPDVSGMTTPGGTTAPGSSDTTEPSGSDVTTSVTTAVTTAPPPAVREEYSAIHEKLTSLKAQYPDLFGWIYIAFDEDHVIDLPVMQGEDNNYYIDHAYDGTESKSGAIFADYRNTDRRIDLNQNMIFYGHNMNNNSMFALVSTKYKTRANFDSVPIVFYSLEGVYTFNVFSVYNANAGDDFDTVGFGGDALKIFCEQKQLKSFFKKNLTFDGDETILTLVTCTNYVSDGRVIVHGVLDGYDSYFE